MDVGFFVYLCSRISTGSYCHLGECGEIWLLATTIKNAKMLTSGHLSCCPPHINVFVFAPHFCGAFLLPEGAAHPIQKNRIKSGQGAPKRRTIRKNRLNSGQPRAVTTKY